MLKRLFYPLKYNIYIFLLLFLSLLPFSFLVTAKSFIHESFASNLSKVSDNCLFDTCNGTFDKFSEVNSFFGTEKKEIENLSKKDYISSDIIVTANTTCLINGKFSFDCQLCIGSTKNSLIQYMNMFQGVQTEIDLDNELYIPRAFADSFDICIGDELYFSSATSSTKTIIVGGIFNASSIHSNDFYIVLNSKEIDDNFLSDYSCSIVHYYKTVVTSFIVREGITKYNMNLTSKTFEIENRMSGYNIIFDKGKLIVAIVSIAISLVSFYSIFGKWKKIYPSNLIHYFFYENKRRSYLLFASSNLLLVLISFVSSLLLLNLFLFIFKCQYIFADVWVSILMFSLIQLSAVLFNSFASTFLK